MPEACYSLKGTQGRQHCCTDQTEEEYNKTIENKNYPRKQQNFTGNRDLYWWQYHQPLWKKHCAFPGKITQFLISYFIPIPEKNIKDNY